MKENVLDNRELDALYRYVEAVVVQLIYRTFKY